MASFLAIAGRWVVIGTALRFGLTKWHNPSSPTGFHTREMEGRILGCSPRSACLLRAIHCPAKGACSAPFTVLPLMLRRGLVNKKSSKREGLWVPRHKLKPHLPTASQGKNPLPQ